MHSLIIGNSALRQAYEAENGGSEEIIWVDGLDRAFSLMDSEDVSSIVFDIRRRQNNPCPDLKALIARTPVTTRVMAIVEQLPEDQFFVESGVIYLTPPVQLKDIDWFIRSSPEDE